MSCNIPCFFFLLIIYNIQKNAEKIKQLLEDLLFFDFFVEKTSNFFF